MGEVVSAIFSALIFEVNALPVSRAKRDEILLRLEFLRTQSLCDTDRRKPVAQLREVWTEADKLMAAAGLYERYTPSKKIWDTVFMFVEVAQFRPTVVKRAPLEKPPSPFSNSPAHEILAAMKREAAGVMDIRTKVRLKNELQFLEDQAKAPRNLRDQNAIKLKWKQIHEELKKRAILRPFEEEPMKSKLLEFLRGS